MELTDEELEATRKLNSKDYKLVKKDKYRFEFERVEKDEQ